MAMIRCALVESVMESQPCAEEAGEFLGRFYIPGPPFVFTRRDAARLCFVRFEELDLSRREITVPYFETVLVIDAEGAVVEVDGPDGHPHIVHDHHFAVKKRRLV